MEAEGASTFLAAITKAGLLTKLDTTPKITVFAPLGRLPSNCDVEGQVVFDFLGYTPELVADTTYGSVKVTKKGETFYANGLKIVKSDVLTKNGVVHYVESVSPSSENPSF